MMNKDCTIRKLFTPIRIGSLNIRNRVCMPAMHLQYAENRHCSDRMVEFYRARAAGGCGLIIVGGVGIDLVGSGVLMPTIESDEHVSGFRKLADACHDEGAAIMLQLFHGGRYVRSALIGGQKAVAPSPVPCAFTKEEPRALSQDEILEIQDKFTAAAERAKRAGMDGVEICGSAGYLVCQFLSPLTNKRDDEYGGTLENRARFACEVIRRVRERVGEDFVVTIRVAGNDFVPGSNTSIESARACRMFEQTGVDAISVTGGWHEARLPQLPMMVPRGAFSYLASAIKRAVSVPVMVSNRIVDPRDADRLVCDGVADMVCVGRAQVADPDWVRKAMEGRFDEIRPCVGCMQGCLDRIFSAQPLCCLANPQAGFEIERCITKSKAPKKVFVVGAGPAGLEAACVAAERGHDVAVFDRVSWIGGQLRISAGSPHRREFGRLIEYFQNRLKKQRVKLCLNTEVTPDLILNERPDAVILAVGSEPLVPDIPGAHGEHVVLARDVLLDRVDLGERVVIVGGGAVGIETAIAVATKGTPSAETVKFLLTYGAEDLERLREICRTGTKRVTVIEMGQHIGKDIGLTTRWVLLGEMRSLGVKTITGATLKEIREHSVLYAKDGELYEEPADTVVLAMGSRVTSSLGESFRHAGIPVSIVGDCVEPRKAMDAIREGYLAAMEL